MWQTKELSSAPSENQNTELFYQPDDEGTERGAEDKEKEAVS